MGKKKGGRTVYYLTDEEAEVIDRLRSRVIHKKLNDRYYSRAQCANDRLFGVQCHKKVSPKGGKYCGTCANRLAREVSV